MPKHHSLRYAYNPARGGQSPNQRVGIGHVGDRFVLAGASPRAPWGRGTVALSESRSLNRHLFPLAALRAQFAPLLSFAAGLPRRVASRNDGSESSLPRPRFTRPLYLALHSLALAAMLWRVGDACLDDMACVLIFASRARDRRVASGAKAPRGNQHSPGMASCSRRCFQALVNVRLKA